MSNVKKYQMNDNFLYYVNYMNSRHLGQRGGQIIGQRGGGIDLERVLIRFLKTQPTSAENLAQIFGVKLEEIETTLNRLFKINAIVKIGDYLYVNDTRNWKINMAEILEQLCKQLCQHKTKYAYFFGRDLSANTGLKRIAQEVVRYLDDAVVESHATNRGRRYLIDIIKAREKLRCKCI